MAPTDAETETPAFPIVLRGYDRDQVRRFIDDLDARLAAERRRRGQAEQALAQSQHELATLKNQPPPSFEHLGAEAAAVIDRAGQSAKVLIDEAKARGAEIIEEATARAAELVRNAERQAAEIDAAARRAMGASASERERLLAEANEEARRVRDEAQEQASRTLDEMRDSAGRTRERLLAEQAELEGGTARLRQARDQLLAELGHIHDQLGLLVDGTPTGGVPAATKAAPAGPTPEA